MGPQDDSSSHPLPGGGSKKKKKKKKNAKKNEEAGGEETKNQINQNKNKATGPPSLLQIAFEFFDVRQKGIFRPEEVEEILYRLGRQSSARVVEELVDPLIGVNSGRICYPHLLH